MGPVSLLPSLIKYCSLISTGNLYKNNYMNSLVGTEHVESAEWKMNLSIVNFPL